MFRMRSDPAFYKFFNDVNVAVREMIGNEPWFRGVCMDGIDSYFDERDLAGAIRHCHDETIYHDRPARLDY